MLEKYNTCVGEVKKNPQNKNYSLVSGPKGTEEREMALGTLIWFLSFSFNFNFT